MGGTIVNEILISFIITVISGVFHGLLGFGFPMIATPLLSLIGTVENAILITLLPTLSVNGASVIGGKSPFRILRKFWLLGLMVAIGSVAGTNLLVSYKSDIYELILALMILLYLNQKRLNISIKKQLEQFPISSMLFFGLLSGLVSGLVNVMIPILIIYVLELKLEKVDSIVLMNFCFFSSKIMQVLTFSWMGVFTVDKILLGLFYGIVAVTALMVGKHFNKKIDSKMFNKILQISLWAMAFMLVGEFLVKI